MRLSKKFWLELLGLGKLMFGSVYDGFYDDYGLLADFLCEGFFLG